MHEDGLGEPDVHSTSHDVQPEPHGSVSAVSRYAATQRPASVNYKGLKPNYRASLSREPLSPPALRAQVSTARRDCGRVGIALRFRRAWSRSSSATPRAEGSSGRQVVSASAFAAQGHCWPSGRSGAGWGRSQGLPWVGGGLGGALRRQGRRSSRARLLRAYPPSAASPKSSAWRGGGVKIGKVYGTVFFRLRIV